MSVVNPVMIFRGRMVMQGVLTAGYATSFNRAGDEYLSSDKNPYDAGRFISHVFGSTLVFGAGTIGIWAPTVKAGVVGSIATTVVVRSLAVTGAAVTAVAPLAAGYAIGATAGTVIANEVWGEQGASDALDFYTGQANYSSYFDIAGNASTIIELGIKPAIESAKSKAKQTVKQIGRVAQLKRPRLRRWRFW